MNSPAVIRDMLVSIDRIIGFLNPTVRNIMVEDLHSLPTKPRFSFLNDGKEIIENLTEKELLTFLEGIIYGAETCSSIT